MWNKNGRLINWKINPNADPYNPNDSIPTILVPRMTRRVGEYEDSIIPSCYGGHTNNLYTYYNNDVWSVLVSPNLFISTNSDGSIKTNYSQASILKLKNNSPTEYVWVPNLLSTQKIKNEYYPYDFYDSYLKNKTMIWKDSRSGNTPQYAGSGLLIEAGFANQLPLSINSFFVLACKNAVPKGFYYSEGGIEREGDTYVPSCKVHTNIITTSVSKLMTCGEWTYYKISNTQPQNSSASELYNDDENTSIAAYANYQSFGVYAAIGFDIPDKSKQSFMLSQYVEHQLFLRSIL